MKAIILAAGEGKRLRPLTNNTPKCLVNLFGKSLLQWQIETFRSCQIDDISVVTGYRSKLIDLPGLKIFQNKNLPKINSICPLHVIFVSASSFSFAITSGTSIYSTEL